MKPYLAWCLMALALAGAATGNGCVGPMGSTDRFDAGAWSFSCNKMEPRMVRYDRYLRGLPAERLAAEYAKVAKAHAGGGSEDAFFRLVVLLSLPGTDFQDNARAMKLLSRYLAAGEDGEEPDNKEYARHLLAAIRERTELTERCRLLETQLRLERKHSKELKEKLDALKKIEKSIRDRQEGVASP